MATDSPANGETGEGLSRFYLVSVALLLAIAPVISILIEAGSDAGPISWWDLGLKWFAFWAVGARLFLAGIRQTLQPGFTAQTIFRLKGEESHAIVRELGMANLSMGALGLASIALSDWRVAAAMVGGFYYGFAGAGHIAKKSASPNETVALVSDVGIFAVLAILAVRALVAGA